MTIRISNSINRFSNHQSNLPDSTNQSETCRPLKNERFYDLMLVPKSLHIRSIDRLMHSADDWHEVKLRRAEYVRSGHQNLPRNQFVNSKLVQYCIAAENPALIDPNLVDAFANVKLFFKNFQ